MPPRRRTHRKPVLAPDEKPDPIVDALTRGSADPERPADEVHKGATAGEAATGTPVAGRSTIAAVAKGGPSGFLQILGPGVISGASDDDPSGIGTYSQWRREELPPADRLCVKAVHTGLSPWPLRLARRLSNVIARYWATPACQKHT